MSIFERIPGFYEDAKRQEVIFHNILADIKTRVGIDPAVPKAFDPTKPIDEILAAYAPTNPALRRGRFTIIDFRVGPYEGFFNLGKDEAAIGIQDIALMSGSGSLHKYGVQQDLSVQYKGEITRWMS